MTIQDQSGNLFVVQQVDAAAKSIVAHATSDEMPFDLNRLTTEELIRTTGGTGSSSSSEDNKVYSDEMDDFLDGLTPDERNNLLQKLAKENQQYRARDAASSGD